MVPAHQYELRPGDHPSGWLGGWGARLAAGWLASGLVHLLAVSVLAVVAIPWQGQSAAPPALLVAWEEPRPTLEAPYSGPHRELAAELQMAADVWFPIVETAPWLASPHTSQSPDLRVAASREARRLLPDSFLGRAADDAWYAQEFAPTIVAGTLADVRSYATRRQLLTTHGGNDATERAVARALEWIAAHQWPDGGWSFEHRLASECHGQCSHPGAMSEARLAATSMALLPMLGAGQTHRQGRYRKQVELGLAFLTANMRATPLGGALDHDPGRMYSHALSTTVLCEALAMSGDRRLAAPARAAVQYIVQSQDPRGGGWRYFPGEPGDTSVVGWQLMALKSARLAKLDVPEETIARAEAFLDAVSGNGGAVYGYLTADDGTDSTRAAGLLCRMFLGWPRSHTTLARGVEALAASGPSPHDMYFNYYATQVLHHYDGELWNAWNLTLREHLLATQANEGHPAGSWLFADDYHVAIGGRLFCTSLATLTLEVYYRYLPLYGSPAAQGLRGSQEMNANAE